MEGFFALVKVLAGLATNLVLTVAFIWLACWGFGWAFSMKIALGIWAVTRILRSIFSPTTPIKTEK